MNWQQIKTNWPQLHPRVRKRWGRLSDIEIELAGGDRQRLVERIKTAYGISREEAKRQVDAWSKQIH
jgi:uncharacterized protein YjbJ (UPF0337 family)